MVVGAAAASERHYVSGPNTCHPVTRGRKIILLVAIAALAVIGWIAYRVLHTAAHIPEAYAAWDTGTLLVEYMKTHEDRWPASWEDLLTVLDSDAGRQIPLRGAQAGDLQYARSLRDKVAVDWGFDPVRLGDKRPVTRPNGSAFPFVWEEPNEMVQNYLRERVATRPSEAR
jgi:hypothetical protein